MAPTRHTSGDATALLEHERALSLLRATLEATADGILVVDRSGRVVTSNRRFAELWRLPEELIATHDDDRLLAYVLHQIAHPQAFRARVDELYHHPEAESYDQIEFRDGRIYERYSRPQWIAGVPVGRVWSFRDVTEPRRLLREARQAAERAEEAVRVRDELLSIASHELKTPITALQAAVQGILRIAERQTRRLTKLVDNLLDVSRVSAGRLALEREEIDLAQVIRDALDQLRPQLDQTSSVVTLHTPPLVGSWDRARIEEVVTNLLSNAIKYGEGRPIAVTLEEHAARARLSVEDHGIGIPPQYLESIFNRFERAGAQPGNGGLGLGLYIARHLVEAHGGTIHVTSRVGRGSTFTVELPRRPPTPP